jgi:hypothetical protein
MKNICKWFFFVLLFAMCCSACAGNRWANFDVTNPQHPRYSGGNLKIFGLQEPGPNDLAEAAYTMALAENLREKKSAKFDANYVFAVTNLTDREAYVYDPQLSRLRKLKPRGDHVFLQFRYPPDTVTFGNYRGKVWSERVREKTLARKKVFRGYEVDAVFEIHRQF